MSVADVAIARRWQKKQQESGLCVKCREPRVNSQHCRHHADDHAALMRRRRQSPDRCSDCARRLELSDINDRLRRCQMCRISAAEARVTRNARILELANEKTAREIAEEVKCGVGAVRNVILAERRLVAEPPEPVEKVERCPRCHLSLPHASCLAPVWAVAQQRHGESAG